MTPWRSSRISSMSRRWSVVNLTSLQSANTGVKDFSPYSCQRLELGKKPGLFSHKFGINRTSSTGNTDNNSDENSRYSIDWVPVLLHRAVPIRVRPSFSVTVNTYKTLCHSISIELLRFVQVSSQYAGQHSCGGTACRRWMDRPVVTPQNPPSGRIVRPAAGCYDHR